MTKFNPKVGDLVYFQWEDHCSYSGSAWEQIDKIGNRLTGSINETTGFVVDVTRDHITTAASISLIEHPSHKPDVSQIATRIRRAIIQGKIIKRYKS